MCIVVILRDAETASVSLFLSLPSLHKCRLIYYINIKKLIILGKRGECVENVQKCSVRKISTKQQKAIELLIYEGLSKAEIAHRLNIAPQTLSRWLNPGKTPEFTEAFEKELAAADRMRKNNYRIIAQKAQDKLVKLMDSKNKHVAFQACKDLLDRAGDKPVDDIVTTEDEASEDNSFYEALNAKAQEVWNEEDKPAE